MRPDSDRPGSPRRARERCARRALERRRSSGRGPPAWSRPPHPGRPGTRTARGRARRDPPGHRPSPGSGTARARSTGACRRRLVPRRAPHGGGEPEVDQPRPSACLEHDVARLHVAMDEPHLVHRAQSVCQPGADLESLLEGQRPAAQPLRQRLPSSNSIRRYGRPSTSPTSRTLGRPGWRTREGDRLSVRPAGPPPPNERDLQRAEGVALARAVDHRVCSAPELVPDLDPWNAYDRAHDTIVSVPPERPD